MRGKVIKNRKTQRQRMIQLCNDAEACTHALTNTVVGHQWQAINGKSLSSQTHAASLLYKPLFTAQSSINSGFLTQTPIIHVGFIHLNITLAQKL